MALRDQPYLPLYIQDIMTDEKLNECCAATHGVFIKGIMCLMHKSNTYGKLLLKQKYKQTSSKEKNFALMLANHLPYTVDIIFDALTELIQEDVCQFEGDYLVQKRMVHDGEISEKRSLSGSKGGKQTQENNKEFAKAKIEANSEYEYEYNNDTELSVLIQQRDQKNYEDMIVLEMMKVWKKHNPSYVEENENDYPACLQIAYKIAKAKGWKENEVLNGKLQDTLVSWGRISEFIRSDSFYRKFSLEMICKKWQGVVQSMDAKRQENIEPSKITDPTKVKIKL